jgi:hypothetical protein
VTLDLWRTVKQRQKNDERRCLARFHIATSRGIARFHIATSRGIAISRLASRCIAVSRCGVASRDITLRRYIAISRCGVASRDFTLRRRVASRDFAFGVALHRGFTLRRGIARHHIATLHRDFTLRRAIARFHIATWHGVASHHAITQRDVATCDLTSGQCKSYI